MEQRNALLRVLFLSGTLAILFLSMGYLALHDSERVQTAPNSKAATSNLPDPSMGTSSLIVDEEISDATLAVDSDQSHPESNTPAASREQPHPMESSSLSHMPDLGEQDTSLPTQVSPEESQASDDQFDSDTDDEFEEEEQPSPPKRPSRPAKPSSAPDSSSSAPSSTAPSSSPDVSENPSSSDTEPPSAPEPPPPSSEPSAPELPPPSSEPTSSETPSAPEPPVEPEPPEESGPTPTEIEEQIRRNKQTARQLEKKYQVVFLILQSSEEDPDNLASAYAEDPFLVDVCLRSFSRTLSIFPDSFFQQEVVLVLADQFTRSEPYEQIGSLFFVFVSYQNATSSEMRMALLDYAEIDFLSEAEFSLSPFSPEDFTYGEPQSRYLFSRDNPGYGYFLTMSAQQSPEADMGETLRKLLESPAILEQAIPDTPFYDKCLYCCELFLSWRPELSANHAIRYFLEGW